MSNKFADRVERILNGPQPNSVKSVLIKAIMALERGTGNEPQPQAKPFEFVEEHRNDRERREIDEQETRFKAEREAEKREQEQKITDWSAYIEQRVNERIEEAIATERERTEKAIEEALAAEQDHVVELVTDVLRKLDDSISDLFEQHDRKLAELQRTIEKTFGTAPTLELPNVLRRTQVN